MTAYLTFSEKDLASLDAASRAEIQSLAAEAIGWLPLGKGVYLHQGDAAAEDNVIHVVGVPDDAMTGLNVLLLS